MAAGGGPGLVHPGRSGAGGPEGVLRHLPGRRLGSGGLRPWDDGGDIAVCLLPGGPQLAAHCLGAGAGHRLSSSSGEPAAGLPDHLPVSGGAGRGIGAAICAGTEVVSRGWAGEAGRYGPSCQLELMGD